MGAHEIEVGGSIFTLSTGCQSVLGQDSELWVALGGQAGNLYENPL